MPAAKPVMAQVYRVLLVRTMYVWAESASDAETVARHWAHARNEAEESVMSVTPTTERALADGWDGATPYNCPPGVVYRVGDLTTYWENNLCRHPNHDPPSMRLFSPGVYEYTCPGCGMTQRFAVAPRETPKGGT